MIIDTKRVFDLFLAIFAIVILTIPLGLIAVLVKLTSSGPVLYWSKRVGYQNKTFLMPKFRSMKLNTPQLATDLLPDPYSHITRFGRFLRKSSLDELPQLWSVLSGDMSFVGPRPALYNQSDLIELRTKVDLHLLKPGLVGWAQVNGRDQVMLETKVFLDQHYAAHQSIWFDMKIILMACIKILNFRDIQH